LEPGRKTQLFVFVLVLVFDAQPVRKNNDEEIEAGAAGAD
jgi:hypothetical protein